MGRINILDIDTVNKSVKELHTTSEKITKRFESINKVDISNISHEEIEYIEE